MEISGDDSLEKSDHENSSDSETVWMILRGWSQINNISVTISLLEIKIPRILRSMIHLLNQKLWGVGTGFVF